VRVKDGFLLVDKPTGVSSFGVLQQLNKRFWIQKNAKKIGHGGTLDPNASGLLVIAIGKATRMLRYFLGSDKRYTANIRFGKQTTTDDAEGDIIAQLPYEHIDCSLLEQALSAFRGEIIQIPPAFSALHVDGKRAYELARKGKSVELAPRQVNIYRIEMTQCLLPEQPCVELDIACSGGTYIRSIARDLGKSLGSAAYLEGLRRTESCQFAIAQAQSLEFYLAQEILDPWIIPIEQGMKHFTAIHAPYREIHQLLNGLPANFHVSQDGIYTLWFNEQLIAVLERKNNRNDYLRLMSAQEFDKQFGRKS